jgi:hypothetical protein
MAQVTVPGRDGETVILLPDAPFVDWPGWTGSAGLSDQCAHMPGCHGVLPDPLTIRSVTWVRAVLARDARCEDLKISSATIS